MTGVVATFRAVVAVGLLMGVYVLVLGLAVGDAVLVFEVLLTETTDAADTSSPVGAMITVPVVGALFWGLAAVSRPTFTDVGSVPLTPEQAPLLWHTTRQLADAVGTSPPTEIHLVAEVNAGVTEEAWLLGLVGGRRRLYLGLPLVLGSTQDELRAVIAHELGHYAGRHTRLLAITHRSRGSLHEIMRRLELTARVASYTFLFVWVVRRFFLGYAKCFDLLTLSTGRRQEFEADAVAARVAVPPKAGSSASVGDPGTTSIDGRGVVVDALRTQAALAYSWDRLIAGYVAPGREHGIVPERPFDLFVDMLDDVGYRATVDRLRMSPPEPERTRRDTHPTLARRIAALDAPAGHNRDRVRPAAALLGDWHLLARNLRCEGEIEPPFATARSLPNDEWLHRITALLAGDAAHRLRAVAAQHSGVPNPGIGTVLELLGRGHGARMAAALAAEGTPAPGRPAPDAHELTAHLTALVNEALVAARRARWVPSWTQPSLAEPIGPMPPYLDLVRAAPHDPDEALRLRGLLVSVGVDVEAGPPPARHRGAAGHDAEESEDVAGEVGIDFIPRWRRLLLPRQTREERRANNVFNVLMLATMIVGSVAVALYIVVYEPDHYIKRPIPTYQPLPPGDARLPDLGTPGRFTFDPDLTWPTRAQPTSILPPLWTLVPRN
ncbi:M48 family metallopeptidase [Embleya sp. MST-111070]|uniref:M48 family metallopeptidase n=1 Tax=Embleya sp. MST-111070 TaxID=3398231 RepID=UPI003F732260